MGWISADGSGEPEGSSKESTSSCPLPCLPTGRCWCLRIGASGVIGTFLHFGWMGTQSPNLSMSPSSTNAIRSFHRMGTGLSFTSNRSGRDEIYVKRYPAEGGLLSISTDGGHRPFWAPHSGEIFYREGDKMMTASVETQPNVRVGKPRTLFVGLSRLGREPAPVDRRDYDPTPDGQRFLIVKRGEESVPTQINVVLNWAEELKRLVPTEK